MQFLARLKRAFVKEPRQYPDHALPDATFDQYDVWRCPSKCSLSLEAQMMAGVVVARSMPPADATKPRPHPIVDPRGYFCLPKGMKPTFPCLACQTALVKLHKRPIALRLT